MEPQGSPHTERSPRLGGDGLYQIHQNIPDAIIKNIKAVQTTSWSRSLFKNAPSYEDKY